MQILRDMIINLAAYQGFTAEFNLIDVTGNLWRVGLSNNDQVHYFGELNMALKYLKQNSKGV